MARAPRVGGVGRRLSRLGRRPDRDALRSRRGRRRGRRRRRRDRRTMVGSSSVARRAPRARRARGRDRRRGASAPPRRGSRGSTARTRGSLITSRPWFEPWATRARSCRRASSTGIRRMASPSRRRRFGSFRPGMRNRPRSTTATSCPRTRCSRARCTKGSEASERSCGKAPIGTFGSGCSGPARAPSRPITRPCSGAREPRHLIRSAWPRPSVMSRSCAGPRPRQPTSPSAPPRWRLPAVSVHASQYVRSVEQARNGRGSAARRSAIAALRAGGRSVPWAWLMAVTPESALRVEERREARQGWR